MFDRLRDGADASARILVDIKPMPLPGTYRRIVLSFPAYALSEIPISDLTPGNATLGCSLVEVRGQPNGNRNIRDISIERPVTNSTGDVMPVIGVALAAKIQ